MLRNTPLGGETLSTTFGDKTSDQVTLATTAPCSACKAIGAGHTPGAVIDPDASLSVLDGRLQREDPTYEGLSALVEPG